MGRGKAQVKPKGGGSGHGVKKAKKVFQEVSKIKSKRSVVAMLLKAKAKPDATLLTQGHLEVGDPVEVKEAGGGRNNAACSFVSTRPAFEGRTPGHCGRKFDKNVMFFSFYSLFLAFSRR